MENIIKAIVELVNNSISDASSPLNDVKKVFFGDPIVIPESDLPAVTVQPVATDYEMRGSKYDQKNHTLQLRLIYNAKSYFGSNSSDNTKVFAIEDAIRKVEKSDNSHRTNALSLCGIIQNNTSLPFTDGSETVNSAELARVSNVNYTFSKDRGFPAFEVVVTVAVACVGDR